MTLTQLKYALVLQKYGSFKVAAYNLEITQPALSLQISKLERELDLLLFDRTQSPVAPTAEGQQFLIRAQDIVVQSEELKTFADGLTEQISGKLVIGIIPTLAPFLVPLFADSLQQNNPQLKLDICELTTDRIVAGVRNGELDTGIISTPINIFGINSTPLFYEKFFFYVSGNYDHHDIRLNDVEYEKLWLLNEGNCFRDQINNFCNLNEVRKRKSFVYRSNSIDALIRIVDTKGGITILPELTTLMLNSQQEENIRKIEGRTVAREIGLITRDRNNKGLLIDELIRSIKNNIPHTMLYKDNIEVVDPDIQMY